MTPQIKYETELEQDAYDQGMLTAAAICESRTRGRTSHDAIAIRRAVMNDRLGASMGQYRPETPRTLLTEAFKGPGSIRKLICEMAVAIAFIAVAWGLSLMIWAAWGGT